MTVKEEVIRKSIKLAESRLAKINALLEADGLGDLIALHKEAAVFFRENNVDANPTSIFSIKVSEFAKRERDAKALIKKTSGRPMEKLMTSNLKLKLELADLTRELNCLEFYG